MPLNREGTDKYTLTITEREQQNQTIIAAFVVFVVVLKLLLMILLTCPRGLDRMVINSAVPHHLFEVGYC